MRTFLALTKRHIKVFFKDKGLFFSSLITPIILLILYATFLASVYKDSFVSAIKDAQKLQADQGLPIISVPEKLIDGTVAAQLFSSLLAVSCVTVAFCSNLIMIQDKVNGVRSDFIVSPAEKSSMALSYFTASLLSTLIVSFTATIACFIYILIKGCWYMSFADVMLIIADVVLLTTFGTALSSIVNVFLTTNGQAQAVGTIVSAGYGFLCGAYMPINSFNSEILQNALMFLPGTYGTSLIRNHALKGVFAEMESVGFPPETMNGIKASIDCRLSFFGANVEQWVMYLVLIGSVVLLIGIYILLNVLKRDAKRK